MTFINLLQDSLRLKALKQTEGDRKAIKAMTQTKEALINQFHSAGFFHDLLNKIKAIDRLRVKLQSAVFVGSAFPKIMTS